MGSVTRLLEGMDLLVELGLPCFGQRGWVAAAP